MRIKVWSTASVGAMYDNVVSLTMLDNKRVAFVQSTSTGMLVTTITDVGHHIEAPYIT